MFDDTQSNVAGYSIIHTPCLASQIFESPGINTSNSTYRKIPVVGRLDFDFAYVCGNNARSSGKTKWLPFSNQVTMYTY